MMGDDASERIRQEAAGTPDALSSKVLKLFGDHCRRSSAIVQPDPVKLSESNDQPDEIKIACISLSIKDEEDLAIESRDILGTKYLLRPLKREAALRLGERLSVCAESACKQGAKFICANELGHPVCHDAGLNSKVSRDQVADYYRNLSKQHDAYILAGTYHCMSTFFNLAALFHPGELAHVDNPLLHAKKVSAHRINEKVLIPYSRFVKYYKTKYATVAVMICLDSYDPTLLIGMVRAAYDDHRQVSQPDIVFIPSFNPNPMEGLKAAKAISYFLSSIVVVANESHCGGRANETVFVCGESIEGLRLRDADEVVIYSVTKRDLDQKRRALRNRPDMFYELFGVSSKLGFRY